MALDFMTDQKIAELLSLPKKVKNPSARSKDKPGHQQTDYHIETVDGRYQFTLYLRQSTRELDDFSCGLKWEAKDGEVVSLVRYNGSSHVHTNALERDAFDFVCHIHQATERYIVKGKRPDGFAEQTDRYKTLKGALHCLIEDCSISGLRTSPDEPDLFD